MAEVTKHNRAMAACWKRSLLVRALARADAGAALVEMVVVAPMLLLLLVGLIEVGRYGDYAIKVANAARAGAQYGAQSTSAAGDNTGIQNAATSDAGNLAGFQLSPAPTTYCQCDAGGSSPNCTDSDCPASSTDLTNHHIQFVEVDTRGTLPSLLNYQGLPASLRTITVTAKAIMRVAQ